MAYKIKITHENGGGKVYEDLLYDWDELSPVVQTGVTHHYKYWLYKLCYVGLKQKFEATFNKALVKKCGVKFSALDCCIQSRRYIYESPRISDHVKWLEFIGSDAVYELGISEIKQLQKNKIESGYTLDMIDNKVQVYIKGIHNKNITKLLNKIIYDTNYELVRQFTDNYTSPEILAEAFRDIGVVFWEGGIMAPDEIVAITQHLRDPELGVLDRDSFRFLKRDFKAIQEWREANPNNI